MDRRKLVAPIAASAATALLLTAAGAVAQDGPTDDPPAEDTEPDAIAATPDADVEAVEEALEERALAVEEACGEMVEVAWDVMEGWLDAEVEVGPSGLVDACRDALDAFADAWADVDPATFGPASGHLLGVVAEGADLLDETSTALREALDAAGVTYGTRTIEVPVVDPDDADAVAAAEEVLRDLLADGVGLPWPGHAWLGGDLEIELHPFGDDRFRDLDDLPFGGFFGRELPFGEAFPGGGFRFDPGCVLEHEGLDDLRAPADLRELLEACEGWLEEDRHGSWLGRGDEDDDARA